MIKNISLYNWLCYICIVDVWEFTFFKSFDIIRFACIRAGVLRVITIKERKSCFSFWTSNRYVYALGVVLCTMVTVYLYLFGKGMIEKIIEKVDRWVYVWSRRWSLTQTGFFNGRWMRMTFTHYIRYFQILISWEMQKFWRNPEMTAHQSCKFLLTASFLSIILTTNNFSERETLW